MKYIALAMNENGKSFIIENLQKLGGNRAQAQSVAIQHCKKNNLIFQDLLPVKGTERQDSTLTKTIKNKRGRKVYWKY